ncbi:MAG TPA: type VII secretion integral membrane protein EccD [Natronosporangium sp.]|nr:type VII secretion integral membrane protein EccD [Natronosporangium sp.]
MDIGLSRITVDTPHRRLDVAVPDRAPVAELLPELLRLAGAPVPSAEPRGWVLRRAAGEELVPSRALRDQGVRDGEVLYLVPVGLRWPEPGYDDPAAALAAAARGPVWNAGATRAVALATAAVLLTGGLAVVLARPDAVGAAAPAAVAAGLLAAAAWAARSGRDGRAGVLFGWAAMPYASAAAAAWSPANPVVAGTGALLVAALAGWVATARPVPVRAPGKGSPPVSSCDGRAGYAAGATVAVLGGPAALAAGAWGAAGAAAVLACVLVCGFAALPLAVLRLAGLPPPPVADAALPGHAGRLPGADRVARADQMLAGALAAWCVLAVGCAVALVNRGGTAGLALAGLTATALLLRARHFAAVRHRLVMVVGGTATAVVAAVGLVAALPPGALAAVVAVAAGAALAVVGAGAIEDGPLTTRLAAAADQVAVVGAVPLAAGVLGLYGRAAELMAAVGG